MGRLMVRAADLQILGQKLRRLFDRPVENAADLTEWYELAHELRMHISANGELSNAVPHFVWHFLSDADIRFKEPKYDAMQREYMSEIITILERGQVP